MRQLGYRGYLEYRAITNSQLRLHPGECEGRGGSRHYRTPDKIQKKVRDLTREREEEKRVGEGRRREGGWVEGGGKRRVEVRGSEREKEEVWLGASSEADGGEEKGEKALRNGRGRAGTGRTGPVWSQSVDWWTRSCAGTTSEGTQYPLVGRGQHSIRRYRVPDWPVLRAAHLACATRD
jgi:hypothetical protein